jgi:hypothetical protein
MLSRRSNFERLENDRLLLGRVDMLLCRIDRLLRRKRLKSRDARKRHDPRRTPRDVSPHVVAVPHETPARLHDCVTIGERVRPRMDALLLATWDQTRRGGPTAYGRVCSGLWKKCETALKSEKIAAASIAMLDSPAEGSAAGIGA